MIDRFIRHIEPSQVKNEEDALSVYLQGVWLKFPPANTGVRNVKLVLEYEEVENAKT